MSKHVEICHHVTEFVGNARKYMILEHEKLCCRVREAGNVTSKFPRGIRKEPSAPYAAVLDGGELVTKCQLISRGVKNTPKHECEGHRGTLLNAFGWRGQPAEHPL